MIRIKEILDTSMRNILKKLKCSYTIYKDDNVKFKNGFYYVFVPGGSYHFYEVDVIEFSKKCYSMFLKEFQQEPDFEGSEIVNPFDTNYIEYDFMVAKNVKEFDKALDIVAEQSVYAFDHSREQDY